MTFFFHKLLVLPKVCSNILLEVIERYIIFAHLVGTLYETYGILLSNGYGLLRITFMVAWENLT